jgi:putative sterol carrier protein
MFRIVNVQEAIARRTYDPEVRLTVRLTVFDAEVDENRGECRVVFENGRAEIGPWQTGKADVEMTARMSYLSQIFAGEISPTAAAFLGGVELKGEAALLDRVFATKERFWLFDEF